MSQFETTTSPPYAHRGGGTPRKIEWGHFQKPLPYLRAKLIFFGNDFSYLVNVLTLKVAPYSFTIACMHRTKAQLI